MRKYLPGLIIFMAGACTMIFEISCSRLLGPYFGTSIFVWTSLIGVIMAGLSLGYWLGGNIADRNSGWIIFGWIILASGFFIFITVIGHDYILRRIIKYFPYFRLRTLIAAVVLFGPVSIFLGIILPYGAKLLIHQINSSGTSVGILYALSTSGSIVGTFITGFVLLPRLGFANVLYSVSGILMITSLLIFIPLRKVLPPVLSVVLLATFSFVWIKNHKSPAGYIDIDTPYNRVLIYNSTDNSTGRPVKILRINDEKSSAMFTDTDNDLVFEVLKYYRLVEHFKPDFTHTLMIGGSGYAFPKDYLHRYPHASIDVVEIDPDLTRIAKKHFNLPDDPRLKVYHEDGRTYLNRCKNNYDAVFMDAYKSMLTIPYQLTTQEAVQRISDILTNDGVVFANIISNLDEKSAHFLRAETATYKSVFPKVILFAVQYPEPDETQKKIFQNFILVGMKSPDSFSQTSQDPHISDFLSHIYKGGTGKPVEILTDEFAPVEFYADKAMN